MAGSLSTFLILSSVLLSTLFSVPPLAFAEESNVLLTGGVLATDSQLSYLGLSFVMQDDCNLVLYNKGSGFQSNTHANGVNCSLTLNDLGQLIIHSSDKSTVWTSPVSTTGKKGKYAAVLRPDGQVAVYGPALWSTPALSSNADAADDGADRARLANIPMVRNVLFSSQILYDNAKLASRDYTFVMQNDCNLALVKAADGVKWQSGTSGKGRNCFLRLDHQGQLAVQDDHYKTVWSSKPAGKTSGDYVLVLQINGQAVVYGPSVWSTSST
ncbi:mannose-specific lectin 3-like [Iris pallida]|uniref:Mannose-specific lectin 3-like n=1 Tax=Iris pallida TaxID=29817 RepID=A0AAX6ESM7_IRIPA|nr:mannose-specific lectin 3-like [Iris pallida]